MALEKAAEVAGIGKTQPQRDLLDRQPGVGQIALRLQHQPAMQHTQRRMTQQLVADPVQLGRRDAQAVGQRGQGGLLAEPGLDQRTNPLHLAQRAGGQRGGGGGAFGQRRRQAAQQHGQVQQRGVQRQVAPWRGSVKLGMQPSHRVGHCQRGNRQ